MAKVVREGEIKWNRLVWKFVVVCFIILIVVAGLAYGAGWLALWILEWV